jgi:hypothetical protein
MSNVDRRAFLGTTAFGTSLGFLSGLQPVSAAEARIDSKLVTIDSGIEPLVKWLEETPREKLLEEAGTRIKTGLSYQELLTALFLAGVCNVQPRPTVGFKFHAVLMINSAHLASQAAADRERWLPILWAVDRFKDGQAATKKESGWRMKPVNELKLPAASKARREFIAAMENWDEEAADTATAAMARTAGANELFDLYAHFGCRDFRDIGHKAIYVANAFRTLQAIGWQHAEPILRSLTYALLQHEGDNPAKRQAEADRPGRLALEKLKSHSGNWRDGIVKPEVTRDLLDQLRTAKSTDMADRVLAIMNGQTSVRSAWDALFLGGAELLMRQPGIVSLHSLTSLNALHYAFQTASDEQTRKLLLLQAAAFVPLFREAMASRNPKMTEDKIDRVLVEVPNDPLVPKLDDLFATLTKDKRAASQGAFLFLKSYPDASRDLIDHARRLIFLKGTDSHDYKFSAAVMEDYSHLSPGVRDQFLAASLHWLKGSGAADSALAKRITSALS